jgi:hypothetical protein
MKTAEPRQCEQSSWFGRYKERVSCVCQFIVSRAPCRSVFRSAPPMSSKAAAARMGICRFCPATSFCLAAGGSIFRRNAFRRLPRGLAFPCVTLGKIKIKVACPDPRKNFSLRQEPLVKAGVDCQMPGEAPSPSPSITRRRTPAVFSGRGSSFFVGAVDSRSVGHRRRFSRQPGTAPILKSSRTLASVRAWRCRVPGVQIPFCGMTPGPSSTAAEASIAS